MTASHAAAPFSAYGPASSLKCTNFRENRKEDDQTLPDSRPEESLHRKAKPLLKGQGVPAYSFPIGHMQLAPPNTGTPSLPHPHQRGTPGSFEEKQRFSINRHG